MSLDGRTLSVRTENSLDASVGALGDPCPKVHGAVFRLLAKLGHSLFSVSSLHEFM